MRDQGKANAYGGVVVDAEGRVLLRRVSGDFGGARWTFSKGREKANEKAEDTACRETREETGWEAEILERIPGTFEGTTTLNAYWLMAPVRRIGLPDWETSEVGWYTAGEARDLIRQSPNSDVVKRDLAVLDAAIALRDQLTGRPAE